jgi:hypothetical protein
VYWKNQHQSQGRENDINGLTLFGLELYLGIFPLDNIRDVAKAHSDMLMVFEKWGKFVKNNCEEAIKNNLREAIKRSIYSRYLFEPALLGKIMVPENEEKARRAFDYDALGFMYFLTDSDTVKEVLGQAWIGQQKIFEVIESDKDLKKARKCFFLN